MREKAAIAEAHHQRRVLRECWAAWQAYVDLRQRKAQLRGKLSGTSTVQCIMWGTRHNISRHFYLTCHVHSDPIARGRGRMCMYGVWLDF